MEATSLSISANTSAGVLYPSIRLGRMLSESDSEFRNSGPEGTDVPFGMYSRMSPLVFSFVPRSHDE